MAITTLDGALAGMQPPRFICKQSTAATTAGVAQSLWATIGAPSSGAYDTTTVGGVNRTSTVAQVQGQIFHGNPGSGNAYLARFEAMASGSAGVLILADRILEVGATSTGAIPVAVATASSVNSTGILARDSNGSSAGVGVMLGVEINTVLVGGGGSISFSYTNSTGTAAHTAVTMSTTSGIPATAGVGSFVFTSLAAGDIGVQSVQNLTISTAWTSGGISVVLYRPICSLEIPSSGVANAVDALTSGFPQLFNGTVPFLIFVPNSTQGNSIVGSYLETQG